MFSPFTPTQTKVVKFYYHFDTDGLIVIISELQKANIQSTLNIYKSHFEPSFYDTGHVIDMSDLSGRLIDVVGYMKDELDNSHDASAVRLVLGEKTRRVGNDIELNCDFGRDASKEKTDEKNIETHFKKEFITLANILGKAEKQRLEVVVPLKGIDIFSFNDKEIRKQFKRGNNMLYFKNTLQRFIASTSGYSEANNYEHPDILDMVYARTKKICPVIQPRLVPGFIDNCGPEESTKKLWYAFYMIQQLYTEVVLETPKLKMLDIFDKGAVGFRITFDYSFVDSDLDYSFEKDKPFLDNEHNYFVISYGKPPVKYTNLRLVLDDPPTFTGVASDNNKRNLLTLYPRLLNSTKYSVTVEEKGEPKIKTGSFAKRIKSSSDSGTDQTLGLGNYSRTSPHDNQEFYYIENFLFSLDNLKKYKDYKKSSEPQHIFIAKTLSRKESISMFFLFCEKKLGNKYTNNVDSAKIINKTSLILLKANIPFFVRKSATTLSQETDASYFIKSTPTRTDPGSNWVLKLVKKKGEMKIPKGSNCDTRRKRVLLKLNKSLKNSPVVHLVGGQMSNKKTRNKRGKRNLIKKSNPSDIK
jgi:hypothetical protein